MNQQTKYRNKKTVIDGITFDSKRESDRYFTLKIMEQKGMITDLKRQVEFELIPSFEINGRKVRKMSYIADFTYFTGKTYHVEDSKGFRTKEYKIKKKLFEYKYGVVLEES